MKSGTKVRILVDTWMAESGATGIVHTKNFSEGYISVKYDEPYQGVFDFKPDNLEVIE